MLRLISDGDGCCCIYRNVYSHKYMLVTVIKTTDSCVEVGIATKLGAMGHRACPVTFLLLSYLAFKSLQRVTLLGETFPPLTLFEQAMGS